MKKTYKRYGEAFKQQVVKEYEAGASVNSLQKKYDIRGSATIAGWIKKYARDGFRHEMIQIQTTEDIQRIKTLEDKIQELEQALGKIMLEKLKLESTVEELEESYGVEIKKTMHHYPAALGQNPRKPMAGKYEGDLWVVWDYTSGLLSKVASRSRQE
jgi:transposase-like protein